jgi:hypothetical protein
VREKMEVNTAILLVFPAAGFAIDTASVLRTAGRLPPWGGIQLGSAEDGEERGREGEGGREGVRGRERGGGSEGGSEGERGREGERDWFGDTRVSIFH